MGQIEKRQSTFNIQTEQESQRQNEQAFSEHEQALVDYETEEGLENILNEYAEQTDENGIAYPVLNILE